MDPVSIALICTAVFGTVMVVSAFIRQLLISRDKRLNDEAQSRAIIQEAGVLEQLRAEMKSNKRFDIHYQIIGANRDAIKHLDNKIEQILFDKKELVERYAQTIIKESESIITNGQVSKENKALCDELRKEIDSKMSSWDNVIKELQNERASLWGSHIEFQKLLLAEESARNTHLDKVYEMHSALLEKVYVRHIEDTQEVAVKGIEASTVTFKDLLLAPIQFLTQFFTRGVLPNIALVQNKVENNHRVVVEQVEHDINTPGPSHKPSSMTKRPVSQEIEETEDRKAQLYFTS